ncbi:MAG: ABC transporter permease subunit [Chloroflexota bacterium]
MATNSPPQSSSIPFYRDQRVLRIIAQVVSAIVVFGLVYLGIVNMLSAADALSINLTFDFLNQPAGFPISDTIIEYDPSLPYRYAILVGLLNTLRISLAGIVLATILGTFVALARLSSNWLLSKLALGYIEFHRNIPLLVLLFLWYTSVFQKLPSVADAFELPGPTFISQRGVFMTWPRVTETGKPLVYGLLLGILLAYLAFRFLRNKRAETGKNTYYQLISLAILIGGALIGWFASGGSPLMLDIPERGTFNFQGGNRMTPEYAALFIALIMYTAGFIAEVVRAGIQSVSKGQMEAASAVGLKQNQTLSLVILPQALRVIIPPMISQYLNLTKNSSLALAIGYQDVFSVGKIAINQSGRSIPVFVIIMGIYLSLSLITSAIMNVYNRRIQFVSR